MEEMIQDLNYQLGYFNGMVENFHTCTGEGPPQQDCHACRKQIERYVARSHMEMSYLLFGWDAIVDSLKRALDLKIAQRDANRQKGAFI